MLGEYIQFLADHRPTIALTGISAVLLFVTFLVSAVPVFGRFVRRKRQLTKRWENLTTIRSNTLPQVAPGLASLNTLPKAGIA
jgi:Na+-transporting methylmalonyl-CoA/oxaloacetate decarboxylase gamma subunit